MSNDNYINKVLRFRGTSKQKDNNPRPVDNSSYFAYSDATSKKRKKS